MLGRRRITNPTELADAVDAHHERLLDRHLREQDDAEREELSHEDIAYLRAEASDEWQERHGGGL